MNATLKSRIAVMVAAAGVAGALAVSGGAAAQAAPLSATDGSTIAVSARPLSSSLSDVFKNIGDALRKAGQV